jgi:hypothetical protein
LAALIFIFCLVEMGVLIIGGLAWNWQDLLVGLLLPIAVLLINAGINHSHFRLFQPTWWMRRYQVPPRNFLNLILVQVGVLSLLICGANTIGRATHSLLMGLMPDRIDDVFVVLLQAIVLSLRTFSRMDEADMKIVDIHGGIDSMLILFQSRFKAKTKIAPIQVMKHYGNLPSVECYAGQINQVFMHILTNAIDALEELGSDRAHCPQAPTTPSPSDTLPPLPTITIKTEMLPGERILIQISNNGARIPDAIQKRLFEPFFTTKPVGKGMGLGLSISYGIVTERHGGQLQCISLPGEETTFVIEIPQHQSVKSA